MQMKMEEEIEQEMELQIELEVEMQMQMQMDAEQSEYDLYRNNSKRKRNENFMEGNPELYQQRLAGANGKIYPSFFYHIYIYIYTFYFIFIAAMLQRYGLVKPEVKTTSTQKIKSEASPNEDILPKVESSATESSAHIESSIPATVSSIPLTESSVTIIESTENATVYKIEPQEVPVDLPPPEEKPESKLKSDMKKLSVEQKQLVDMALGGLNCFFTGSAGTGKRFVSHLFILISFINAHAQFYFKDNDQISAKYWEKGFGDCSYGCGCNADSRKNIAFLFKVHFLFSLFFKLLQTYSYILA